MTALNKLPQRLHSLVQGQYLMTYVTERQMRNGQHFQMVQLEDSTGELAVYVREESAFVQAASLLLPVPVRATLYIRHESIGVVGELRSIHCATDAVVENAARLLPRSACPKNSLAALAALDCFNEQLTPLPLRNFLNQVLLDLRVADDLMVCPASEQSYRAHPGGLLEHSVAVLQLCETLGSNKLTPLELAVAQVAALMHQIDRIRIIRARQAHPECHALFDPAARPNQMLEFHLERLDPQAPEIAKALRGALEYLNQPHAGRAPAPFIGAKIGRDATRMASTLVDGHRITSKVRKTVPADNHRPTLGYNPFDPQPS